MKLYIPSTSRSDVRNTDALRAEATRQGHELALEPSKDAVAILLGDRSEMLSVARACLENYCPWVHVGAGCVTRGSWDQTARAMLTAGASKAWPYTHDAYEDCLDKLDDQFYHGHGVPILDTLKPDGRTRKDYALVAINPVTAHNVGEELDLVDEIADSCKDLGLDVIWSDPNEDRQGIQLFDKLDHQWPFGSLAWNELAFHHAIQECRVIVGNSSAALIEAPVLGTPHVDCGCRQSGRPLSFGFRGGHITNAIRLAIDVRAKRETWTSPYQHPERKACESIIHLCEEVAREKVAH